MFSNFSSIRQWFFSARKKILFPVSSHFTLNRFPGQALFHYLGNDKNPPSAPFFKGANGGMPADASLKKAMERKVVAFLKKLKSH